MKQMILKVDENFTGIPIDLGLTSAGQLVGSRSYYNKILILVLSPYGILELEDRLEALNAEDVESGKTPIDFEYSVIATEDEPLNILDFEDYMLDVTITDGEGSEATSKFSDLATLTNFAGKKWLL